MKGSALRQGSLVAATFAALASLAAACGPSFQAIYEGDARFEHCYALEESTASTVAARADCWRDWSERYTYGQTRDRVQYAIARYVALSQAGVAPTDEALMMAAPGGKPRDSTITVPAPTSLYAPPPKTLDPDASAPPPPPPGALPEKEAPPPPAAPALSPLPKGACTDRCVEGYRACTAPFEADRHAGKATDDKRSAPCARGYATCMRGCFK